MCMCGMRSDPQYGRRYFGCSSVRKTSLFQVKEGAGSSFSFFCTEPTGELSSSEVTRFVAKGLKDKVDQLQDSKDSGNIYLPPPQPSPPKDESGDDR